MLPVLTKASFVERYRRGIFGNAAPTWNTLADYLDSGYTGDRVHIRNRVAGGPTWYNVQASQVADYVNFICPVAGVTRKDIYFSGMAPHEHGTIQGEVQRTEKGLYLYYNLQKVPMREGFQREQLHAWGLTAKLLLQRYLNAKSYDWLEHLLDTYEGHVVEFSAFDVCWGTLPGYNCVYWELRLY